jgi:hypothetical protein
MGTAQKYCLTIFLVLFVYLLLFRSATEARPLSSKHSRAYLLKEIDGGFFRPVNSSGPSPPGGGHKSFKHLQPLGEAKHSGPSPGAGHKFVTGRQQQLTPSSTVP